MTHTVCSHLKNTYHSFYTAAFAHLKHVSLILQSITSEKEKYVQFLLAVDLFFSS